MEHEDYKLSPTGTLGEYIAVSRDGYLLGEYVEIEDALACARKDMEDQQYWPSIWWVSDHGNYWQIDINGNEIKEN